tara:strand:- start:86088 stop:88127 length:2040 start_codon:yes stop_codon:yes gene_type:complete
MTEFITSQQSVSLVIKPTEEAIVEGYRKDIDGLRAIAVLLVIFYHIFGTLFTGGFVGVDVFFVISGYLISTHIVKSLEDGNFSFKAFYLRRMRRILPAFIVVVFVVNVVGFFVLIPPDLKQLSQASLSGLLSVSNLYFWKVVSVGYFNTDASVLPLLHTWSLGVEEQFYLVWPIVLFLLFNGLNQLVVVKNKQEKLLSYLGITTIFFTMTSFFIYYYFRSHPNMVFYTPITRAFELLSGASLAIYWTKLPSASYKLSFVLSLLGVSLIIYAASYFSEVDFPSSYIILPCVGALLLIYAGKTKGAIINEILSFKIMSFLGLISYSLYLWHWPIVAYINYLGITVDASTGVMILVASISVSYLSYRYVEQPFRNQYKFNLKHTILLFIIIPILMISAFILGCKKNPNFGFNQIDINVLKIINDYHGPLHKENCMDAPTLHPKSARNCSIGDLSKDKLSVLIVGDSHAMALAGMLNRMLDSAHLKGYLVAQSGTPFLIGNIHDWRENLPMKRNELMANMIKVSHYDYVVLGGYWSYYPDKLLKNKNMSDRSYTVLEQSLDNAIKLIVSTKSKPILFLDVPPLLRVPTQCGFTRVAFNHCSNSIDKIEKVERITKNILLRMRDKYPSLILIDPSRIICPSGECVSALQGIPLYHTGGDNSHLNHAGSALLGDIYLQHSKNPFV